MGTSTKKVPCEKYMPVREVRNALDIIGFQSLNDKRIKFYRKDGETVVCLDDLRKIYNEMVETIESWREDEEFWS